MVVASEGDRVVMEVRRSEIGRLAGGVSGVGGWITVKERGSGGGFCGRLKGTGIDSTR